MCFIIINKWQINKHTNKYYYDDDTVLTHEETEILFFFKLGILRLVRQPSSILIMPTFMPIFMILSRSKC